jgi:hypothetical protein
LGRYVGWNLSFDSLELASFFRVRNHFVARILRRVSYNNKVDAVRAMKYIWWVVFLFSEHFCDCCGHDARKRADSIGKALEDAGQLRRLLTVLFPLFTYSCTVKRLELEKEFLLAIAIAFL